MNHKAQCTTAGVPSLKGAGKVTQPLALESLTSLRRWILSSAHRDSAAAQNDFRSEHKPSVCPLCARHIVQTSLTEEQPELEEMKHRFGRRGRRGLGLEGILPEGGGCRAREAQEEEGEQEREREEGLWVEGCM